MFSPEAAGDGLEVFYDLGLGAIRQTTRSTVATQWTQPVELDIPDRDGLEPTISADHLSLYYREQTDSRLMRLRRGSRSSAFGSPEYVGIGTGERIDSLDISSDEERILLVLQTNSEPGLYIATRSTLTEPFGVPTLLLRLIDEWNHAKWNATEDEIYLSDGKDLYISRLK